MPNTFKSVGAQAIGTTAVSVYSPAATVTATAIGVSVANILPDTVVNVDVTVSKGVGGTGSGTETHLVKNAPIAPGGSLIVVGGDQKVVLETGNQIRVRSSLASSVDSLVSVLEITP